MVVSDRWQRHRTLRTWWGKQTKEEQAAWYIKQPKAGTKRTFDSINYGESAIEQAGEDEIEQDHYVPFHVFKRRHPNKAPAEVDELWAEALENSEGDALFRRGEWCLFHICMMDLSPRGAASEVASIAASDDSQLRPCDSVSQISANPAEETCKATAVAFRPRLQL